ncbi:MAG: HlyD family efflux transporter periplasmic adaptor subunit [Planctomycetaceae bacterium]
MSESIDTRASKDDLVYRFRHDRPNRRMGLAALCGLLFAALGLFAWQMYAQSGSGDSQPSGATVVDAGGALTHPVARGRLLVTVVAAGNMESAKNLDVKCQVAGGTSILKIVPEGTEVEEGASLVTLDSSTIEDQLNAQKINLGKAKASKIQAEENFEAAEIAVQEYAEGTFVKELQTAEANISIAQENLRSSENLLEHTRKMSRKGFTTALQVEADEFAVERSKLELDSAKTARTVLEKFTRKKMLKELEAKREAADALRTSEQAAFNLEEAKERRLEKQLLNCEIKAPQKGIVIYANDQGGGRGFSSSSGVKIEEGATVRESQTILRLPDLSNMQVKMTVHESKVERLKVGMTASVRISGRELSGKIISIANQPEPGSWMNANLKEYATIVKIDEAAKGLKPAMTAEVEVVVADLPDVLTVPVSCIVERGGKFNAWVVNGPNKFERRPLTIGKTNDKVFEIIDGLKEGDLVLLNPKAMVEEARKEEPRTGQPDADQNKKFGSGAAKTESNGGEKKLTNDGSKAATDSAEPKKAATRKPPTVVEFMKSDTDKDGKISKTEAPEQMQRFFENNDTDKDGFLDATEVKAMVEKMKAFKPRPTEGGGGPPSAPGGQ